MSIRSAGLAVLACCLAAAPGVLAGGPGKWTQLGEANLRNIDEVSLARTPDGVLHAAWVIPGSSSETIVHDSITPKGVAAAPQVIQANWAAIDPVPDLVASGAGLRTFFGGIRTLDPNEPNNEMNTATAPPGGDPWSLVIGSAVTGDAAYTSDTGAALEG